MTAVALAVVSSGFVLTLVLLIAGENPAPFVFAAACYLGLTSLVLVLLIAALSRWVSRSAAAVLASLVVAATAFSLYLVHLNQGMTFALAFAVAVGTAFAVVLFATRQDAGKRLIGAAALGLLPLLALLDGQEGQAELSELPQSARDKLAAYGEITLKERPNIYLISFDAMIPLAAAKKLLDIDALPYEERLQALGAVAQPNMFVTDTPSVESLDAVMKLDDRKGFPSEGYFAGRLPSPLANLMRANGYWVETGSSIPFYFGAMGQHVDAHLMIAKNLISDSSMCKFASELAWHWGSFGFCRLARFLEDKPIFDLDPVLKDPEAPYFDSAWHQKVLRRIADPPPESPRLLIYYYYYPIGHAPNDFDSADPAQMAAYRDRFRIQARKLAEVVEDLYTTLQREDPGAVVMFFGDHGTKISRTVNWREDTEYWVQDHHAVHLSRAGFGHECTRAPYPPAYQGKGYMTMGRVLATTLRCLSADPDALDQLVEFSDKFDFSQYLLE